MHESRHRLGAPAWIAITFTCAVVAEIVADRYLVLLEKHAGRADFWLLSLAVVLVASSLGAALRYRARARLAEKQLRELRNRAVLTEGEVQK